ncbi:molecular chaperone [Microbulbifer sp. Q7]|uniref:fimbrial biogenesis chaperone n=1 Tax=Microbulbifer sp. Q7 TaxID=1785091 RepID=UPI00082FEE11|nr:fimbria/pilus periplasmic chaperone [Microbulbifer sp. Q7]
MKKILAVLFACVISPAWGAMSLDKMIVYLKSVPNARDDIVVRNPDDAPLYLQTEIFRVENPGAENQTLVPVTDPKDFKLLVSPSKAVIAPGEERRFRLMSIESNVDSEKVYRVTFRPVVGEIQTEATGLKLLVAFQAVVFVQPVNGQFDLALSGSGSRRQLKNTGNVNVEISSAAYCSSPSQCENIGPLGRVYPGGEKTVELPGERGHIEVRAFDGKEARLITLPL